MTSSDELIRVSCAILCRFVIGDRYLFLLNRNRREQGIYELSPLGGAIEAHPRSTIFTRLGLQPEIPTSNDLRFFMFRRQLDDFRRWFNERQWRETDPFRELQEELVDEAGILSELQSTDVETKFLYVYEDEQVTNRSTASGALTHYFLEVFEIRVTNPEVEQRLLAATSEQGVLLLDENTARQSHTVKMMVDGAERTVKVNASSLFQDRA